MFCLVTVEVNLQSIVKYKNFKIIKIIGITSALVIIGLMLWKLKHYYAGGQVAPGAISVVRGNDSATPLGRYANMIPVEPPVAGAAQAVKPEFVQIAITNAYPELKAVRFDCQADRCEMVATPVPPTSDADRDRQQAMLSDGLHRLLTQQGYPPLGPIQFDEIDDDIFEIHLATQRRPPA